MVVINSLPSPVGTGLVGVAQITAVVYISVIECEIPKKIFVRLRTHDISINKLRMRSRPARYEVEVFLNRVVYTHPTPF